MSIYLHNKILSPVQKIHWEVGKSSQKTRCFYLFATVKRAHLILEHSFLNLFL